MLINMDESSLALHWFGLRGTILRAGKGADKVTLRSRRARATYICSIEGDPIVQKVLPQILIGNVHCFSKSFTREAASLCPASHFGEPSQPGIVTS